MHDKITNGYHSNPGDVLKIIKKKEPVAVISQAPRNFDVRMMSAVKIPLLNRRIINL
jgi:hypothetical protein